MRRILLFTAVFLGLALPAWAGFDDGLDAYKRQDYQTALKEFQPLAERGHADAQNMLGLMYFTGRGVLQDYVRAHLWFNLAAVRGRPTAAKSRDDVARLMTPRQVAQAQQLARDWRPKPSVVAATTKSSTSKAPRLSGRAQIAEIQRRLTTLGYQTGPADGLMGWQTRSAIRSYQGKYGLPVNGGPSQVLLDHLYQTTGGQKGGRAAAVKAEAKTATDASTANPRVEETRALVRDLRKLVRKGERQRLADPAYLAELRQLTRRYSRPRTVRVLSDEFADGNYSQNPAWTVVDGAFTIPWAGGLSSTVTAAAHAESQGRQGKAGTEDVAVALLSQILGAKSADSQAEASGDAPRPAEILTEGRISNSFSLISDLELGEDSACVVGLYGGSARENGYYLELATGRPPTLVRVLNSAEQAVKTSQQNLAAEGGGRYRIKWTRERDGRMRVGINNRALLDVRDTEIRADFAGFAHLNKLGQCRLHSIVIDGSN